MSVFDTKKCPVPGRGPPEEKLYIGSEMLPVMKVKHAIVILILGFLLDLVGATFKIEHWPFADVLILSGLALQAAGLILLLWRLMTSTRLKGFMNS